MLKKRSKKGVALVEAPLMLWIIFVILFMPMIGLATIALKTTLLGAVLKDAVSQASKCRTFSSGSTSQPSATSVVQSVISEGSRQFGGLRIVSSSTSIIATNTSSGAVTRSTVPLSTPANTGTSLYQLEVSVVGQIDPLIGASSAVFGAVPGLSAPIPIEMKAREFFETAAGLNR